MLDNVSVAVNVDDLYPREFACMIIWLYTCLDRHFGFPMVSLILPSLLHCRRPICLFRNNYPEMWFQRVHLTKTKPS
jgi:hypothetical protein